VCLFVLAASAPTLALADGAPPTFDCSTGGRGPFHEAGDCTLGALRQRGGVEAAALGFLAVVCAFAERRRQRVK